MNNHDYHQFTDRLRAQLVNDPRVLGLVALGSMAGQSRQPDQWSDHDFFVITHAGLQEDFRQDLSWLPDADRIVLSIRETAHGLKVLYESGHLIEFAVFDEEELYLAKINDYRVLFDGAHITDHLAQVHRTSVQQDYDETRGFALFLSYLLLGAGRDARGERLSAHRFIKDFALLELLHLLGKHLPMTDKTALDNLDPFRRFELVFPEIAARLHTIMEQPPLIAARHLLLLAHEVLREQLPNYPLNAVETVQRYLNENDANI